MFLIWHMMLVGHAIWTKEDFLIRLALFVHMMSSLQLFRTVTWLWICGD